MYDCRYIKQLVLNKGQEKYIFRYEQGQEDGLLDALVASVRNPGTSFDWYDAAVLSFKLTQSLLNEADRLLNEGDNIDPTNQKFNPQEHYK